MKMNSKTRVLTALANQKPDRVPFNFWMDRREMAKYEKHIGHRHWRVTHFGADVIESFASLKFPSGEKKEHNGSFWVTAPYFTDWSRYKEIPLPNPDNEEVYALLEKDLQEFPNTAVFLNTITPWGIIAGMRTYENIYMDMYEYAEEFKKLSRKILDIQKRVIDRACRMGITALYVQEDLATSKGLSMSPEMLNEFCLDFAAEMVEIADTYDKPVLFHSDGKVTDLIEPLLKKGFRAINPLQHNLNDPGEFKTRFGDRMCVYGGLDNCFIIPQGTPSQIRDHVAEVFEKLGKPDGGLIMSTHDIPLGTPVENIQAMVDTIKNCRYQTQNEPL